MELKLLRVLALVTEAYGGKGGIAQFNRNLFFALDKISECSEVIVVSRIKGEAEDSMPLKVTQDRISLGSKSGYVCSVLNRLAFDRDFDFVICGHINLIPLAKIAKFLTKSRMLLVIHGIESWSRTTSILQRNAILAADACLAVSGFTKQRFLQWANYPDERCVVIPNVFDPSKFRYAEKPKELVKRYELKGKRTILTLARLSSAERYKGIDEVLEVLPVLRQRNRDLVYLIGGEGDDRVRLQKKARDLHVLDIVRFIGWIDEKEKADHYRLADAFVMPGRGEGFGIVYLESLACGTPVVGSTLDGSRDALRGGELGVLVNPDMPQELVEGIEKALSTPKGVPNGLEQFELKHLVLRLEWLLSQLSLVSVDSA